MMVTADAFRRAQRCVVVGISRYKIREDALKVLPSAAETAEQLGAALASSKACNIPSENIALLTNENADKASILSAISSRPSESCRTLLIYFSGHGIQLDSRLYLCAYDTIASNLESTGLSCSELVTAVKESAADSVLVILDCCKGGSLTGSEFAFFSTRERAGYRILLSASDADEPSWDPVDGSGTLFSRVLVSIVDGSERAGVDHGRIYFSELLAHIHTRVEEYRRKHAEVPAQTPVFIGVYPKDPLIILLPGQFGSKKAVVEARYSRAYLRQLLLRAAICLSMLIVFAVGVTWAMLQHSQFALIDQGHVVLYEGIPGVHMMGYPHLLLQTEWTPDQLTATSFLRRDGVLSTPLGGSIREELRGELLPVFQVSLATLNGDQEGALRIAHELLSGSSVISPAWLVTLVLDSSVRSDARSLQLLAALPSNPIFGIAIDAWAALDPAAALQEARTRTASDSQTEVLKLLTVPCGPEVRDYITSVACSTTASFVHDAAIDAAIRLKCDLDEPTLWRMLKQEPKVVIPTIVQTLQNPIQSMTSYYAVMAGKRHFLDSVAAQVEDSDIGDPVLPMMLYALAYDPDRPCLDAFYRLLGANDFVIANAAAFAVAAHCDDAATVIPSAQRYIATPSGRMPDFLLIAFLADHYRLSADELVGYATDPKLNAGFGWFKPYLSNAPCTEDAKVVAFLETLVRKVPNGSMARFDYDRVAALTALDLLDAEPAPFFDLIDTSDAGVTETSLMVHTVSMETALWYGRRYPNELFKQVVVKSGQVPASEFIEPLGRARLRTEDISFLHELIRDGSTLESGRAVATYVQKADIASVVDVLDSPYLPIRMSAMQYVSANTSIDVEKLCASHNSNGVVEIASSCHMLRFAREIQDELGRTPHWAVQGRVRWFLQVAPFPFPGYAALLDEVGRRELLRARKAACIGVGH